MNFRKIYRKRRAVSPILAAILLIGLAVAAGAVMFVVVLPLITGPGLQVAYDSDTFGFTDTDAVPNKIFDKVNVPIMNTGTIEISVTGVKVQTSSDGGTNWNDATVSVAVPFTIVGGASAVKEISFVPTYNDFLVAGDVQYRVVTTYKPEGEDTTSTLESPVITKAQDGLTGTMADIDASYYYEYTIDSHKIDYCPRDDNSTPQTTRANVIAITITNNWDCDLVIDQDFGAYAGWENGLYASTDSTYAAPTTTGRRIYAMAFPENSYDEVFCENNNNYDYYASTSNYFWTLALGQTGTVQNTVSLAGRTITPGETIVMHYFGLGSSYTCIDGTTYYFALSFHGISEPFRWSEQVNVAAGSYS
jgi:hypothetical protein